VLRKGTEASSGPDTVLTSYKLGFGVGWEIDFWGKFRRATEAARAELLGTEEARRTVVLTLVSAVAASYVDIRALDNSWRSRRARRTAARPPWNFSSCASRTGSSPRWI
jgi:multidrug efflux system outer membrane protein